MRKMKSRLQSAIKNAVKSLFGLLGFQLEKWFASNYGYAAYPAMMSKQFTLNFFKERGFTLAGEFFIPMNPGLTDYLIFVKD